MNDELFIFILGLFWGLGIMYVIHFWVLLTPEERDERNGGRF
jgi:hypothetical protein